MVRPVFPSRTIFAALALALFLQGFTCPETCWSEAAVLPLHHRNASEILPIVKELLSPEGRAAVDVQSNSLVLVDTPESIGKVRAFLERLDQPVRQAKVRVRFNEVDASRGRSLSVDGAVSGDKWRVSTGRRVRDGVEVRAQDRRMDQRGSSEFFILVSSGSWGYIVVGREIPYTQKWVELCRRYARVVEGVVIQRIETGMEVRPVLMGDQAEVEIMPRISHEVPGRDRALIRFASASTRVSVPIGQWTDMAGADREQNEVIRAILESGSASRRSSLGIAFMVEAAN